MVRVKKKKPFHLGKEAGVLSGICAPLYTVDASYSISDWSINHQFKWRSLMGICVNWHPQSTAGWLAVWPVVMVFFFFLPSVFKMHQVFPSERARAQVINVKVPILLWFRRAESQQICPRHGCFRNDQHPCNRYFLKLERMKALRFETYLWLEGSCSDSPCRTF